MRRTLPPGIQANVDQDDARLRDLVAAVRDHRAGPCRQPHCPGRSVARQLLHLGGAVRARLLLLAITALARVPRPAHTDAAPGEPAEDAIVRVDTPTGAGYFVRDDTLDDDADGDQHWWPLVYAASPLTWQQVSADGPPVVLAPSTPDTQEGHHP